jgi:integrase
VQANRTLSRLRALFNWAVEKERVASSPAVMKLPTQEQPRDRVLSDDELRWLLQACDAIGPPFGPLTKLLVLTGQRLNEVASMTWSEVDLENRLWTIPRERAKNDRAHEVQLSDAALAILRSLRSFPRICETLIFTTTGKTPVSGFSRAKRRLDSAMLEAKRAEIGREQRRHRPVDGARFAAHGSHRHGEAQFRAACRRQGAEPQRRHDPRRGGRLQQIRLSR